MSVAEIRSLPLAEKLQIMEAIWEDLRSHIQDSPIPDWHKKLLDERREAVKDGTEKILDWDDAKQTIGRRSK